jgi:hypothetical protein
MENYIRQLIEDLLTVAQNPPKPTWIQPPPHLEEDPVIAELALVPFQTIEELTGIKQEVFPDMDDLQGDQWERVNDAILKVFDSLFLELVDVPPDIPPEWLYEVLTTNWQEEVQYLPSSGMDLEFCTGNPMTCPYGDYCDCDEDWDPYELPEKYNHEIIGRITQAIEGDIICYLNPETLEIEYIPKNSEKQGSGHAEPLNHKHWKECYVFHPLEEKERLEIINKYFEWIEDENFKEELYYILESNNPIANFNAFINNSHHNTDWFLFNMDYIKDRVRYTIYKELNQNHEPIDDNKLPF